MGLNIIFGAHHKYKKNDDFYPLQLLFHAYSDPTNFLWAKIQKTNFSEFCQKVIFEFFIYKKSARPKYANNKSCCK